MSRSIRRHGISLGALDEEWPDCGIIWKMGSVRWSSFGWTVLRGAVLVLAGCMLAAGQTAPDGTVLAPNGRGRFVWKRKGIWKAGALER